MLRIIGGKFKGRRLNTPRGQSIRPTADRVREAIFNILGGICRERLVIDLFAGTGAMGLEALSRGAGYAIFVDSRRTAIDVIAHNIAVCRCETNTRAFLHDIRRNLSCLKIIEHPAELVFIDPPYHLGLIGPALGHLHHGRLVANNARVVIEHAWDEDLPADDTYFRLEDRRRYGKTLVSFLHYVL